MVRLELVRDKVMRLRDTAAALRSCLPGATATMASNRDALVTLVDPFCDAILRFAERPA